MKTFMTLCLLSLALINVEAYRSMSRTSAGRKPRMCRRKCANPENFLFSPEHFKEVIIKEREENDYNYDEYERNENEIIEKLETGGVVDEKYFSIFEENSLEIVDQSWNRVDKVQSGNGTFSKTETGSHYKEVNSTEKNTINNRNTTSIGKRFPNRGVQCNNRCIGYVGNLYKAHNLITNKLKNVAKRFFGTMDNLINCNPNRLQYRKFYLQECRQFPSRVYKALMNYFDTRFNQENWCNNKLYEQR